MQLSHYNQMILRFAIFSVVILLLIFGSYKIYEPGIYGPLLLDDNEVITPLITKDINMNNWYGYLYSDSGIFKRPVSMLSFMANAISSSNDISIWKYTNVMLHIINGIMILYLSYLINYICNKKNKNYSLLTGAIISIIWLIHPLHVSTVLYTVQRMTELSALFLFGGLIFYLMGRHNQLAQRKSKIYFVAAFFIFYPLSVLSKENGVIMPVICILLEIYFFNFLYVKRGAVKLNIPLVVVLIAPIITGLIYLIANYNEFFIEGYLAREFTAIQRLLTEMRVIFIYILQIIIPIRKYMGFIHDGIDISSDLLTPPTTLVSLVLLTGLIIFIIYTYKWNKLISFGLAFYLSAHLIESTILPLEIMYEHRNYVPSFGIIITGIGFIELLSVNIRYIIYACVIIVFSSVTLQRVYIWSSLELLYSHIFKIHPDSPRMASVRAKIYMSAGKYDEARSVVRKFNTTGAYIQLLNIECAEKYMISDVFFSEISSALNKPVDMIAMDGISVLSDSGLQSTCHYPNTDFIKLLDKLIELPVTNKYQLHKLYVYKAYHLWNSNDYKDAIVQLEKAGEIIKDDPVPFIFAAAWSFQIGNIEKYNKYYNKVVEINKLNYKDYTEEIHALRELSIK